MFDYKGYTAEELVHLCGDEDILHGEAKIRYWTSEIYSFGQIYRDYARFPKNKMLYVYSNHGITYGGIFPHELENTAEAMFDFEEFRVEEYKKLSKKPVYHVLHPYVWFRKSNNITQDVNAKGTLAFPSHSTSEIDRIFDIDEYISILKNLPDEMQPVCVCLHMHDINKGLYKKFIERGIPVYTAGNAGDIRFAQRYYDILKNFKYTTSNSMGSYVYYSIDLGIPFSLLGEEGDLVNIKDKNFNVGKINTQSEYVDGVKRLFSGINKEISEEQKLHVEYYLGVNNHISREKMYEILNQAYQKQQSIINRAKRFVKNNVIRKIIKRRESD